jgi:hypothetical protein
MPPSLYVCLQDEDKIAPFTIDADSGRLMSQAAVPVQGGTSFPRAQPGPTCALPRASPPASYFELPSRPKYRRARATRQGLSGTGTHVSGR